MTLPIELNNKSWYFVLDKKSTDDFISEINITKEDIKNNKLFLLDKKISQSKLRDAGFEIKRDVNKSDIVVINNILKTKCYNYGQDYNWRNYDRNRVLGWFTEIKDIIDIYPNTKFIWVEDVYKYLYKYEGNLELFHQCSELFKSLNTPNIQMAMEFMSNANWETNQIYLQELFYKYYNRMNISYKSSISFKGFLNTLDFNYDRLHLSDASCYRELCFNQEHHQFVFDKFDKEFKIDLAHLTNKYKVKINELKYSIDESLKEKKILENE
jgi:hypothetical protein